VGQRLAFLRREHERIQRLAGDHANARLIAEQLEKTPGIKILRSPVETNIIIFSVEGTGLNAREFTGRLLTEHQVRVSPYYDRMTVRAVTHLDVTQEQCVKAACAMSKVAGGALTAAR